MTVGTVRCGDVMERAEEKTGPLCRKKIRGRRRKIPIINWELLVVIVEMNNNESIKYSTLRYGM